VYPHKYYAEEKLREAAHRDKTLALGVLSNDLTSTKLERGGLEMSWGPRIVGGKQMPAKPNTKQPHLRKQPV